MSAPNGALLLYTLAEEKKQLLVAQVVERIRGEIQRHLGSVVALKGDLHRRRSALPAIGQPVRALGFERHPLVARAVRKSSHATNLCPVLGQSYDFRDLLGLGKTRTVDHHRVGSRHRLRCVALISLDKRARLVSKARRAHLR